MSECVTFDAKTLLLQLQQSLTASVDYWRPQPYKDDPPWLQTDPQLSNHLLSLIEQQVQQLGSNTNLLYDELLPFLPQLAVLKPLLQLPLSQQATNSLPVSNHLHWAIPGRKWRQIEHLSNAIGRITHPIVEWCGGKGHLGRLLATKWQLPVTTLEHNQQLCDSGIALAQRSTVKQQFVTVDVLQPTASQHLQGSHAVALHACGELHRQLLRHAINNDVAALELVPCCYHLGSGDRYQPFSQEATLQLGYDDLRLAVTQTATAPQRQITLRNKEMAWKLGYDWLRRNISGNSSYQPIAPIEKQWLQLGFTDFCRQLAQRDHLSLNAVQSWQKAEEKGWQRQQRFMRLQLVRQAFARPLELWLVADMALWLQQHNFNVTVAEFCNHNLTPRNILLSAAKV